MRAERVRENLERVRSEIAGTGRDPAEVQILAVVKYVPVEELGVLAGAGIDLVGENRAQYLVAKAHAYPGAFTWDFIGHLQSRKVRQLLPEVRYIETVASESALSRKSLWVTISMSAVFLLAFQFDGWFFTTDAGCRARLSAKAIRF